MAIDLLTVAQAGLVPDGIAGLLLVLLGAALASLLALAAARLLRLDTILGVTLAPASPDHAPLIKELRLLAEVARRDGPASLARSADRIRDPFLSRSLRLAAQAANAQEVRTTLARELECQVGLHAVRQRLVRPISAFAAALVPLAVGAAVGVLVRFRADPAAIPEMAAGAVVCIAFLAFALNSLRLHGRAAFAAEGAGQALRNSLTIVGLTAIRAGEEPEAVEDRLWNIVGERSPVPTRAAA